ncbi:MAG: 3-isopropylmalate dehydratase small subunit [Coriobacteriia bacterium]|nr:3-isopropylmalate dehydratase small subunit [Coriobacteriia bacterium]MDR2714720.1 3-isopropylmalate dehydratase small subunit [Coriobacteriales bacterium]
MTSFIARSQVIKYGDNVDTDVIIPARYLNTSDKKELARHCMEDIDTSFVERAKTANVIVAGKNFGCGSSREHAPVVIKENGIALIVAASFARIFYRNAFNIGLPIVECAEAVSDADDADEFSADLQAGTLTNHTKDKHYEVVAYPEFIQQIIEAGGLSKLAQSGGLD